ncbi:TIGR04149 family rSAM-modified RiPP [Parabacteroides sp. OttesenSCG-928-G07]|nr:TIGR04149 family rSAM-modified RiPP [Parabacteroides sp. OttesenSCG-928-G07]
MKKLEKLKLNQFSKNELDRRKMNALKGGCTCSDSCYCPGYLDALYLFDRIPDLDPLFY